MTALHSIKKYKGVFASAFVLLLPPVSSYAGWKIEFVDNPKFFERSSLKFDAGGNPRVAFGGDHLYYGIYSAGDWQFQVADSAPAVGDYCSLALDSLGNPAVSYYDSGKGHLNFARRNGSAWVIETVDPAGDTGTFTSLALDSSGRPAISYFAAGNSERRCARWDGSTWKKEVVDTMASQGSYTSLALDSTGFPGIAYWTNPEHEVKYAKWNGSSWTIENVGSASWCPCPSLKFDSLDFPVIAYQRSYVTLAKWDGNNWLTETVDSTDTSYTHISLGLDSADLPAISYSQDQRGDLKYAKWDGSAWHLETIDSAGDVGLYTSLAIDSSDASGISYFDDTNKTLKLAKWNGASWDIQTVEQSGDAGSHCALAIDSSGLPAVSYLDITTQKLKYAKWDGLNWNIHTVADLSWGADGGTSIALDSSDLPVISYVYDTWGTIRYAKWDGFQWAVADTTFAPTGVPTTETSVVLESTGYPIIGAVTEGDVPFHPRVPSLIRWDGSMFIYDWPDLSIFNAYFQISIALDSLGYPAVVYADRDTHLVTYAKSGISGWTHETVDAGQDAFLVLDRQDHPSIAYWNSGLKFAHFDGSEWTTETVDSLDSTGMSASLALDPSGSPTFSYYDSNLGDLRCARWDGSAWVVEAVHSVGDVGLYNSVGLDSSGLPIICYYDSSDRALKCARWDPSYCRILRDTVAPPAIAVAQASLPWTDPDPVLSPSFPSLLFYAVENVDRIVLVKQGDTVTLNPF